MRVPFRDVEISRDVNSYAGGTEQRRIDRRRSIKTKLRGTRSGHGTDLATGRLNRPAIVAPKVDKKIGLRRSCPWLRFQLPPPRTQHEDFLHYALLHTSRQGL